MTFRSVLKRAAVTLAFAIATPGLIAGAALVGATAAEAAVIATIQVQGNSRIDAATVRNYLTVRVGQDYDQTALNNSVDALYDTGLFAYVEVNGNGSTVTVVVVENPVVVQIVFEGNDKLRDDELADAVLTEPRGVLNDTVLAADVRRVEDRYATAGRGAATVEVEVQRLDDNTANVIFHIAEGDRVKIASITFEGNEAFSDRQLRSVIATHETNLLSWLTKNDIYSRDGVAADEEMLRRHYLENGYADFQILSTEANFDAATGEYSIIFNVSEGPLYEFGALTIDSTIPGVSAEMLRPYIRARSGDVFNASDLELSLEDMTAALAEAGNPFAQVSPRANRNYQTNTIDIAFLVDQGQRLYVERIVIVGNDRTRDYVIRREFEIAEGDAYNPVLITRIERRLRDLNLFDQVAVATQQGSAPDQVVLIVEVLESQTGSLSATAGYSTTDGIIGEISLTERNFLGRGQYLRLSVSGNLDDQDYEVSFVEPYFLGRRISLGIDVFARSAEASDIRQFDVTETGGELTLGLPLNDALSAELSYRFVSETRTDNPDDGVAVPAYFGVGTTITSSIGYGLIYNSLDDQQNPRNGFYVRVDQDFAGVGGDVRYVRSTIDARFYQAIGRNSPFTAAARFQAGNITGFGQPVRVLDNFLIGGETIRGFENAGIGPRAADGTPLGGRNYWAASAELRFPMPLFPRDWGFSAAVFADVGEVWSVDPGSAPAGYSENRGLRSAIGASILWDSPFGLLRADFAYALTRNAADSTQVFRLGTGATF